MQDHLVNIEIRDSSSRPRQLLLNATPFPLLFGVWILFTIRKFPNGPKRNVPSVGYAKYLRPESFFPLQFQHTRMLSKSIQKIWRPSVLTGGIPSNFA